MSYDIDDIVAEINDEIATRPITQPGPSQYVDRCWYSRTGWAVHNSPIDCTCKPAEDPGSAKRKTP